MASTSAVPQFKKPADPKADDPKLASIIQPGMDGDVVVIGFPYDEGCTRNGGRAGAKEAPAYFKRLLAVCGTVVNPEFGIDLRAPGSKKVTYGGDISQGLSLEVAHDHLEATVGKVLARKGAIPYVIGGGNDQSAPNGRALLTAALAEAGAGASDNGAKADVAIINIDAHLDVRPPLPDGRVHSGSPFRELLEDSRFDGAKFVEFAVQGQVCSAEHVAYLEGKGGRCVWLSQIRATPGGAAKAFADLLDSFPKTTKIFVSFDIDSVCGADCPGVSAPACVGLSSQEALDICRIAGAHTGVAMMDCSELNPEVEGYRSPRLAVFMFYNFLLGLAKRSA